MGDLRVTETLRGDLMNWQPIATAPRDGTLILGYWHTPEHASWAGEGTIPAYDTYKTVKWEVHQVDKEEEVSEGLFRKVKQTIFEDWSQGYSMASFGPDRASPTHWMPVPPPPSGTTTETRQGVARAKDETL